MRTSRLMTASAFLMAGLGLTATFLPQEVAGRFGGAPGDPVILLLQATGGLYLGFAMLNWFARGSILGGIYNRPMVAGNFLHFLVVALALAKAVAAGERQGAFIAATLVYAAFACAFGWVMWSSPAKTGRS